MSLRILGKYLVRILVPIVLGFILLFISRISLPSGELFAQILYVFATLLILSSLSLLPFLRKFDSLPTSFTLLIIGSLLFMQIAPSTLLNIDRSRSFYVLAWVKHGEIRITDDGLDLSYIVSDERKNPEAIRLRIIEQENRGLVTLNSQGYYSLTQKGEYLFEFSDFLASIYKLNGWESNKR